MKRVLKRIAALTFMLLMIISSMPAAAVEGIVVDFSDSTSAYDIMLQNEEAANATITFVIDQKDYVRDPNSGNTHLKVKKEVYEAFQGGNLEYEEWSGTNYYKIISMGTVCTFSIPSGSTLAQQGYDLPKLEVNNCNDSAVPQDGYRYDSLHGWVTKGGTVCNQDTEFTEDTTLYLQLGEGVPFYTIDFVCGEDNHSIFTSLPFNLGQKLPANNLAEAAEAVKDINSAFCQHGSASGETLLGWQLKNHDTGAMDSLTEELAITAKYTETQYGSAIKAYALWKNTSVTATFTYHNGEQIVSETRLAAVDAKFGEIADIPDMTAYTPEGSYFAGWQYTDGDGNLQYATEETIVTANMTFTAVFERFVKVTFQIAELDDSENWDYILKEERYLKPGEALGALPDLSEGDPLYNLYYKWVYTDENGAEQTATAETIITEDTFITEIPVACGEIFFYDVMQDGSVDEEYQLSISMPVGMTLAQALEYCEDSFEDDTLLRECVWRTAVNGELADLENTVVSAEEPISLYTHTYRLVLTLSRSEAEMLTKGRASVSVEQGDDGSVTMTIAAREGETIDYSEFIADGGVNLMRYSWTDEQGNPVNLGRIADNGLNGNVVLASDGEIVNNVMRLIFTLDGQTITHTIVKPNGSYLTAEDFVVDGIDLTDFVWEGPDGDYVLDSMIGKYQLTKDITLTGSVPDNGLVPDTNKIHFYVYVDNQPFRVASKTVTTYKEFGLNKNRRYISAASLASVYGEYGFSASQMGADSRYFPHKDIGTSTLWGETPTLEKNGVYYSPIVLHDGEVDVFYLPKQSITTFAAVDNDTVVQANSFYTVKVFDPFEIVYGANELPAQTLTYVGGDTSMTVQAPPEGLSWKCVGKENATNPAIKTPVVNADGTLTYVFENISEPYEISLSIGSVPANRVFVVYDLNLPGEPAEGEDFRPKVNGHREYLERLEAANAGAYEVLAPEPTSYIYKSGKYLGDAAFEGWLVNGKLIQPGTKLEDLSLPQYAGQVVNLRAQWGQKYGAATSSSVVNFFVALNAVPEGTTSWQGNTDQSLFTNSVYTSDCGVTGDKVIHSLGENQLYTNKIEVYPETHYLVLGETDGNDLNTRHNTIVNTLTAGYEKGGVTFRCTFPSDETVLKNIRRMVENGTEIRINGRKIEADELTTSFFTIKWYVYKVSNADGWHIDGILVSKSSEMIVTKTFAGDEEVIKEVSDRFSIVVAGKEGQNGMVHTGATLKLNSEGVQKNGNTYTWKVPVDQYYRYSVTENGYKYTQDLVTYKAQYRVRHSENNNENIGWTNYSDNAITVTGKGYNQTDNERLQVDFLNTYTKPGTVVVQKIDAVTGNLMPNVTFRIGGKRTDGSNLQMYDLGGSHYTADPNEGQVLTSTITTNASGQAYLWIGGGTYWLEEIVPNGYDDPGRIKMELAGDPDEKYKVIAITSASAANESIAQKSFVEIANEAEGNKKLTLVVKNHSRTINLKVIKKWKDDDKPVTIQLYRNGKALGADYTVTLNGKENLNGGENWEHIFRDLPLYADGGLAQYTIREEAIGEYKFSDEYADGYQYYNVSYSGMQYLDEDGEVTAEMPQVRTIALQANNELNRGELSIAKVDENQNPVKGAIFYLYKVPDNATTVPEVTEIGKTGTYEINGMERFGEEYTSSENGTVSFGNMPAGRYYLVEHKAPMGYIANGLLYSLQFDGYTATMQYYEKGQWTVTPQRVVNKSHTVDIPIAKVWKDAENTGKRPSSIDVTLTGTVGDAVVSTTTLKLSAKNSDTNMGEAENDTWFYTFKDLPLYSGGKPIVYTLTEAPVAGYETSIIDPYKDNLPQFKITNTLLTNLTYTVNKRVEGNAIDLNKKFNFVAEVYNSNNELIIEEIKFQLSHNDHSYVIEDLPFGAIVKVSEDPQDYSAEYMLGPNRTSGSSYTSGLILDNSQGITFINTKNIVIDTGVDLDGLPYIMMLLGAAGIGLVWLIARRRRDEE